MGTVESVKDVSENVRETNITVFVQIEYKEPFCQTAVFLLKVVAHFLVTLQFGVVVSDPFVVFAERRFNELLVRADVLVFVKETQDVRDLERTAGTGQDLLDLLLVVFESHCYLEPELLSDLRPWVLERPSEGQVLKGRLVLLGSSLYGLDCFVHCLKVVPTDAVNVDSDDRFSAVV